MPRKMKCRHCGLKWACRPRRLCTLCYLDPEIRQKYESKWIEMTEEKLDAMIASRRATMPGPEPFIAKPPPYQIPVFNTHQRGRRIMRGDHQ